MFSTHCPVAIAQIGKLPGTLADRSIHIELKRRAPCEKISRLRIGKTPELFELARKAARWMTDNEVSIRACEPQIPDAIYNRAADNWEPLLAIAEAIGGDAPERAQQFALAACGVEEEPSRGAMLLADIRNVFEERGCDKISSIDLVAALVAMADRPWGECTHGKALTQSGLAGRLKPFTIVSKKVRIADKTLQGYELKAFADAFARYISPFQNGTPEQVNKFSYLGETQDGTRLPGVPPRNQHKSLKSLDCSIVPLQNPKIGDARDFGDIPTKPWKTEVSPRFALGAV
jgi:putative DNA primase/helicase